MNFLFFNIFERNQLSLVAHVIKWFCTKFELRSSFHLATEVKIKVSLFGLLELYESGNKFCLEFLTLEPMISFWKEDHPSSLSCFAQIKMQIEKIGQNLNVSL